MKIPRRLEQCEGCKALFVCTCSVEIKLSEARMQRDELKSRFASETIPSVKDIIRKSFDEISSNIFIYTTEKSRLNSLEYSRKKKALKTSATDAAESSSASLSKFFYLQWRMNQLLLQIVVIRLLLLPPPPLLSLLQQ